jgi:hypothetical protein
VNAKSADGAADEHAHHHAAPLPTTNRTTASYSIPDVKLARQDGTLIRTAPGAQWTRIEGFGTADQLLNELFDATAVGGATVNAMMEDPT